MQYIHDKVYYNGEEQEVRYFIKSFSLSDAVYRNKRKLGFSPQEAFEYCLALKKKKEKLMNINIEELAEKYGVTSQAIYKSLSENKELSEIIAHLEKLKKGREKFQSLVSHSGDSCNNIFEFCQNEGLNASIVYKNLEKGMSFYDAVSFSLNNYLFKNLKHVYLGIGVKYLCQKYHLNYESLLFIYKKSHDYAFSFYKVLFNQVFEGYSSKNRETLWQIYLNSYSLSPKNLVNENILDLFFKVYCRFQALQKDFGYYHFLENFSIPKLLSLSLQKRVDFIVTQCSNITFSVDELYFILDFEHGLMSDFLYIESKNVWIYRGNIQVLEKIKPNS